LCSWHVHKALSDKCRTQRENINPAKRAGTGRFLARTLFVNRLNKQIREVGWHLDGRTYHESLDFSWVPEMHQNRYTFYVTQCQARGRTDAQITANESKQSTCQDATSVSQFIELLMTHLHWHPAKHLRPQDRSLFTETDVYLVWWKQVGEMSNLCKELRESFMWEYLWVNWYCPIRWVLWARATCDEMPIIQSNAPIESHFSTLKKWALSGRPNPSPHVLATILEESFLPDRRVRISLYRIGRLRCSSDRGLVTAWIDAQATTRREMGSQNQEVYLRMIRDRDQNLYATQVATWYCGCPSFEKNPYHICKHLVRALPPSFQPICGEIHRQSTSPILWVASYHPLSSLHSVQTFTEDSSAVEAPMLIQEIREDAQAKESGEYRYRDLAAEEYANWAINGRHLGSEHEADSDSGDDTGTASSSQVQGEASQAPNLGEWLDADALLPTEEYEQYDIVASEHEGRKRIQELLVLRDFLGKWYDEVSALARLSEGDPILRSIPAADSANPEHWRQWIDRGSGVEGP
jgi:hypothetical protein